ncbi:hypothetical protein FDUTEX481_07513 [Tolypothrix sp. PCC 7601]|nr:hypothetical protein FDUTEX481_07513 [Tolypothrix sp. PCC 7601]
MRAEGAGEQGRKNYRLPITMPYALCPMTSSHKAYTKIGLI